MGVNTYPTKKSPVNPEEQRGQTGPGLKTSATGLVSKTPGKGKSGNGFKLADTSENAPGTRTYAKRGAKQSRPGESQDGKDTVPGDLTQTNGGSCCGDLMAKPRSY